MAKKVTDLLVNALRENGFDGLCRNDSKCGCGFDNIIRCESFLPVLCVPGYSVKKNCTKCAIRPSCFFKDNGNGENGYCYFPSIKQVRALGRI